jgi:hypothetical protein
MNLRNICKFALRLCGCLTLLMFTASVALATTYGPYTFTISAAPAGTGTLTYTASYTVTSCNRSGTTEYTSYYSAFTYKSASGTSTALGWAFNRGYNYCTNTGNHEAVTTEVYTSPTSGVAVTFTPVGEDGGTAGVTTLNASIFDPAYKVVSILYSPPGNQSSEGYGTSTTNGTTTTITSSFTFSSDLTFSSGIKDVLGGSASVGYATTSNNSSAFTQTWTEATMIASDDNSNLTYNPTKSDAINHNLDEFVIWLNPQVTVMADGTTPVSYTTSSQPTAGVSAIVADMITLPATTMEATPAGNTGVTTVPVGYLIPQAIAGEDGTNSYMPGLAAICKNQTLYQEQLASADPATPTACTQTNQCGCVPSDFVGILQTDPLLNYNGTTLAASPYNGTVDPLTLDPSGISVCGENPVPTTASCRYQIVPITTGSTTTLFEPLSGDTYPTVTVTDATSTTETTGHIDTHSVGLSFGGGVLVASLVTKDTWTWTDGESWGKIDGTANSMSVTLKTSNADCVENVNIYEDTEFHTFAFQVPTGITTCP